ncbi:MAG: amidohydrolase, partial [Thermomicrobiales bacterium]|nr:amidohydrolase [Thermomicrobiales bacterium]
MSAVADNLRSDIDEIMPGVIADRRYLHTIPELSLDCHKTAAYVLERLKAIGVEDIQTGIAETGITALVCGTKPGGDNRVALIRADMDALPIHEENQVEYISTVAGAMHACGHDAHTAMLIAIAQLLAERRDQFSGTVKLLFQPAEELPPGGAKPMIDAGVLENPYVDAVFGMHVGSDVPSGQITYRPGPALASADFCYITIQGHGGHGAMPHLTVDPVVVAAHVVVALQTIVARNLDPVETGVVTVGMIGAGEANNVIPDTAELRLTIRAFRPEVRDLLERRLTEITTAVAEGFGATATVDYRRGYPPTINDEAYTA